jgi:hypothetical protein
MDTAKMEHVVDMVSSPGSSSLHYQVSNLQAVISQMVLNK